MKIKNKIKYVVAFIFLSISILFFANISLAANTARVNVETANLREKAEGSGKILEQLSLNQKVEVLEKSGDFYKVKSNGITGYVRQDLIVLDNKEESTESKDGKTQENVQEENAENEENNQTIEQQQEENPNVVNKIVSDTKLKIVPSVNATDIIEIKKGEEVNIIETLNDWVCIEKGTTKGWIRKDKIEQVDNNKKQEENTQEVQKQTNEVNEEKVIKTLFVNTDTVNVRKEANTSSEVVTKISLNTSVDVYKEDGGWSKVKVNGKEGYISSNLLSDKKTETSRSSSESRKSEKQESVVTTEESKKESSNNTVVTSDNKRTDVVSTAKGYIGSKYRYGASGPNSFDCSGFTQYVFKKYGVSLNRTALAQYGNGTYVEKSNLQPGDLVMFGPSATKINHVGIYIGGGRMVHAANASRGVTTDTINSGYYHTNYVGARRVM